MKNKSGEECRMKIIEDSKGLVKEFEFILSTMSYWKEMSNSIWV